MTDRLDCIVVGGGVIGLAVARRLAREGLAVTIVERSVCGGEASWAGAGILTPCNPHRTDLVAAWQDRTLSVYPSFCTELLAETGIDPEYEPCGELDLLFTEDSLRMARLDDKTAAGRRMPDSRAVFEIHSPEEARRIEPNVASAILGALECRATAQVRNPRLLQALKASCSSAGVVIREQTTVRDFIYDGSRVVGIDVAPGEALRASHVVLCAGAWSSTIGERLKELMPVHPVRGQMILLKLEKPLFRHIISRGMTYLVPRRDGHILLGSTEEPEAGYTKRNTAKATSKLFETALRLVPALCEATVLATWSGLRPCTPDERPYLGPVPGMEGLIAATGHFRAGLTLAPVTAEAVAALVLGRPHVFDLTSCRPGRTMPSSKNHNKQPA